MRIIVVALLVLVFNVSAEEYRQGTAKVDNLRMRNNPGTASEILGELKKGTRLKIIQEKSGWLQIIAPEEIGVWVAAKFIKDGMITVEGTRIRSGPSVAHQVIGAFKKGDKVAVLSVKDELWAKIVAPPTLSIWVSAAFVELDRVEVVVDVNAKKVETVLSEKEELALLREKLEAEKKVADEARKKILEQQEELAKLELVKNQAEIAKLEQEEKVVVIKKMLAIAEKANSKKLIIQMAADGSMKIGSQVTELASLKDVYEAAGEGTLIFINADKETKMEDVDKVVKSFEGLGAKVYLENPAKLLETDAAKLAEEFKDAKLLLEKSFLTLTVKNPKTLFIGTVPIPEKHFETVLKTYGQTFGSSSVYIQAEPGSDQVFIDKIMGIVQSAGFKLISYPTGIGEEAVVETHVSFNDEDNKPLLPGRVRMSGYVLNVREQDRQVVDFALSVNINGNFYPVAFLKGQKGELEVHYLKEIEVIGIQKNLDGWTKPIIYVEQIKLIK